MTEILTESFCERCGTRYTFETVQQSRPLGRLGTIGRGLKNFVVMSDASLDEAMAVARSDDESKTTTAQLEVFHRTFNFCLQCRQYTCAECWNAVEGRCLTCAPLPVEEPSAAIEAISAAPVVAPVAPAQVTAEPASPIEIVPPPEPVQAVEAGPAEVEPEATAVAEPEPEPEPVAVAEPEPEPELVAEPEPEPEPVAATAAEPQVIPEAEPFPGFRPGHSLDDEIAAYELRIAALAAPLAPEPPIQAAAVHRAPPPTAMAAPAARPAEVAAQVQHAEPGLAPAPGTCPSCGLSISASARFCRRCGARQGA